MDYLCVLEDIKELARKVGQVQLEKLKTSFSFQQKSTDIDIVTEVDLLSEGMIIEHLHQHYPNYSVLSEESGLAARQEEYCWVIDPLDGTTNYLHGFPAFAVSIALLHRDESVLGVVYVPKLNEMFTAIRSEGAYLNDDRISVGKTTTLRAALLSTGFPYDKLTSPDNNLDLFNAIIKDIQGIRRTGSAAFDLCNTASGRIDGYWELKLSKWDIAAGELIVREAGGELLTSRLQKSEKELGYNVIAGNSEMVRLLAERISEVRDYFKQA